MIPRKSRRNASRKNIARGGGNSLARYFVRKARAYCDDTTLHGFKYVTARKSTIYESALWAVICTSSVIFCATLMLRTWRNFQNNPVMTTIDSTNPIWDLEFPAVTICNYNKAYRPRVEMFTETLLSHGLSSGQCNEFFTSLSTLVRPRQGAYDNSTASRILSILGFTIEELMYQVMQPCSSLLKRCAWLGQVIECSAIFKVVKSKEGYCCAFNYHYEMYKEYGYDSYFIRNVTLDQREASNVSSEDIPGVGKIQMVPGTGRELGLTVALNVEPDTYNSSASAYVGAFVMVHNAVDYPDVGTTSFVVQPGNLLAIAVTASATRSSDDVKALPLRKRACLFDGELRLRRPYSYLTCISKCFHRRTLRQCGCLPFYYPSRIGKARKCSLSDVGCVLREQRTLPSVRALTTEDCKCLPQCSVKNYFTSSQTIEALNAEFDTDLTVDLNKDEMSFLSVYFGDVVYVEYRKQTMISWDALLASFGGIFGLCLGGSVISLVELLYHVARDLFDAWNVVRGARKKNILPASKMFLAAPLDALEPGEFNGRVFIVRNSPK